VVLCTDIDIICHKLFFNSKLLNRVIKFLHFFVRLTSGKLCQNLYLYLALVLVLQTVVIVIHLNDLGMAFTQVSTFLLTAPNYLLKTIVYLGGELESLVCVKQAEFEFA
jgi:hypothetical protein